MKVFNQIIEATKNKDYLTLLILQEFDKENISIDYFQNEKGLSAAGQFAFEKQWDNVALLFDNFSAKPGLIVYGAVLGGLYSKVKAMLLEEKEFEGLEVLSRVCKKLKVIKARSNSHILQEVVVGLIVLGEFQEMSNIFIGMDDITQFENGLFSSYLVGFAIKGIDEQVFSTLTEMSNQKFSLEQASTFKPIFKSMFTETLYAAAMAGHLALVKKLINWPVNFEQEDDVVKKRKLFVLEVAFKMGHVELIKAYGSLYATRIYPDREQLVRLMFKYDQYPELEAVLKGLLPFYLDDFKEHVAICARERNSKYFGYDSFELRINYNLHPVIANHIYRLLGQDSNQFDETRYQALKNMKDGMSEDIANAIIIWMRNHQYRATFVLECKAYMTVYEESRLFGRSHYERAKSVMQVMYARPNDEDFEALITQQYKLLEYKEPVMLVLGKETDKHNQVPSRKIETDGFTQAIKKCYQAIENRKMNEMKVAFVEHSSAP